MPTEFEASAIEASLARMGLASYGDGVVVTPLAGGVSSLIARVEGPRGVLCYKRALSRLRTAQEWHAPVERARAEAGYLGIAANLAPGHVPRVLGWDEQDLAFALEWLPPEAHPVWKSRLLAGEVDVDFARSVGRWLATLHAGTAYSPDLAARFGHDAQFDALRLDPYLRATARAHPALAGRIEASIARTLRTKRALVHGDVSPKNLLVGPNGPVFLDAETAWFGDPAFDLAFCANHLLLKCAHRPDARDAYLAAFDALVGAYLGGVTWESPSELETRAADLLPALFLARVDGKSPVEYLVDDAPRARVRRAATALLTESVADLAHVRGRWTEELER